MAFKPWGKSGSRATGTLKLDEWLEAYPGQCEEPFQVVRVSRSQAYAGFSLECLAEPVGLRVFLGETNPISEDFEVNFQELRAANTPLFVRVEETWGLWQLEIAETGLTCQWKRTGSGYTCEKVVELADTTEV